MEYVMVIVACLSTEPGQCRDFEVQLDDTATMQTCALFGQAEVAEWKRSHPKYDVSKYRCLTSSDRSRQLRSQI